MFGSFKRSGANITEWKSPGVYDDNDVLLKAVNTSSIAPKLKIASENGKLSVRFRGNLLKQTKVAYNHGKIIETIEKKQMTVLILL